MRGVDQDRDFGTSVARAMKPRRGYKVFPSEGDPSDAVDQVEVCVVAQHSEGVLAREGGDPGFVRRYGFADAFELQPYVGVGARGAGGDGGHFREGKVTAEPFLEAHPVARLADAELVLVENDARHDETVGRTRRDLHGRQTFGPR